MPPKGSGKDFWEWVDKSGDCWVWTGSLKSNKYGQCYMAPDRRPKYAHRVAWELTYGPIPEGRIICHKCDNPPCVRPDHLFVGTYRDNSQDAREKRRIRFGERIRWSKLKSQEVAAIRRAHAEFIKSLADKYQVSDGHVRDIITYKKRQMDGAA